MTFRTKAEADLWLACAATDTAGGEWVDPNAGKIALREYAKEWLQGTPSLAPKSLELYTYLLDRLILPGLGDLPLNGLTPMIVRKWRADLLRAGMPGPSTVAKGNEKGAGIERATEIRVATPAEIAALVELIATQVPGTCAHRGLCRLPMGRACRTAAAKPRSASRPPHCGGAGGGAAQR